MPWAGKRIVTLGSGAEDLPQNLLTAAEERCLLDPSRRTGYIVNGWAFSDPWESALSETYPRAHGYITRCLWSGHGVWSQISVEARARGRPAPPENAVLCNLTLKQYYWSDGHCRGCKCCSCKDSQGSRDTTKFGLGQVVPIMTCWSHNPSTGFRTRWTQNDVRGKWAGHRLGIVARDSVPADWEDVTEAVRATLIRLTGETR
ncbi:hypothetical protein H4R21_002297 [Coemansia helicoidea]|uniref:Uncharacterized protein n=1 Tax=Coemansia helicoidea TaxID=1286919 RepID=A0ACC1L7E3_9FUNG|nr:hypothetical protein H4R21_002297 [Coemansia helicoidea]